MNRRTYLKLAGVAAASASLAGCSEVLEEDTTTEEPTETGTETPVPERTATETPDPTDPERYELPFERVVNVAEAGADATGGQPIDDVLTSQAENGTLLYFPPGRYLLQEGKKFSEFENLGFVGQDATVVPPDGDTGFMFVFGTESPGSARGLLFEGITFDFRARGTGPFALNALVDDDVYVRDVEIRGRHEGNRPALGMAIMAADGTGLVERARFPDGGPAGTRPVGIFVHPFSLGELTFRDCRVEGFPNNGIYASRSKGPVKVEGGRFRNNDISQVRLGSAGSYARDVDIVVDDVRDGDRNQRGIWLRHPDGVTVENCRVRVSESLGTAVEITGGRAATVRDTDIKVDASRLAVRIKEKASARDGDVVLENVSITGSASGETEEYAIVCNRDGAVFRNVDVEQVGPNRSGLRINAANCLVDGGRWVAARRPIAVTVWRETVENTCFARIKGVTALRATTVSDPGAALKLSTYPDAGFDGGAPVTYCIGGPTVLDAMGESGRFLVVVNDVRDGNVVGRVVVQR